MGGASALEDSIGDFPAILPDQYFIGEWCLVDMTATNAPVFSKGNYVFSSNGALAVMPADVSECTGAGPSILRAGLGWSWNSTTEHLRIFDNDETVDGSKLPLTTSDVFVWELQPHTF
jgi:hypothetical protein